MKTRALKQHLRKQGCEFLREGGKHEIWHNPSNGNVSSIPRHTSLKRGTARGICDQLGVPRPPGL